MNAISGNTTLTIIKPKAVETNNIGNILSMINKNGFKIRAMKFLKLSREQAMDFYAVHKNKEFYPNLVTYMSSGPIVAAILEKENAVEDFRKLIGVTNPENARKETIRKIYGTSIRRNAVHGSDSDPNAQKESKFFFSDCEIF